MPPALSVVADLPRKGGMTSWAAVQAEIDQGSQLAVQSLLSRKREPLRPFRLEDDLVFFRKPLRFYTEHRDDRAIFGDAFCDFPKKTPLNTISGQTLARHLLDTC